MKKGFWVHISEKWWFLLIAFVNEIKDFIEFIVSIIHTKEPFNQIISQMNWTYLYDVAVKIVIVVLLWKLYKNQIAFKEKKRKEFELLKGKIIALDIIRKEENIVINRMFEENNERYNDTVKSVVVLFKQLGVTNIGIKEDDKDTSYYKDVINNSLDLKHENLQKEIDNWDEL
ncbi:MAG TPA: hypothetical protein PKM63_21240 [Panacibacter sp.]|nr:hypothetical protein [Panacibacter sp.]HNP46837.1 hypothetical protein [Panacibacter sp.]